MPIKMDNPTGLLRFGLLVLAVLTGVTAITNLAFENYPLMIACCVVCAWAIDMYVSIVTNRNG